MEIVPARLKEKQCHPFCVIHVLSCLCRLWNRKAFHGIFYQQNVHRICISGRWCNDLSFCAAITDIGRLIQSFALFLHKILASLITGGAGSAFYIAENDFSADIGFPAMEAMNTKSYGHYRKYLCDTSRIDGEPLLLWKWLLDPCKESGQCS